MSASKMNIFEILIEGYVKTPPSLKEQTFTKLAIQLCQNFELKNDIIFESEELQKLKYSIENRNWDILIEKRSTNLCERLHLPPALKNLLIVRIRSIALQLYTWNRQQVDFNLSPLYAGSLLIPSDWTVEMKLDEKKIAERLIQDERIPVSKRYKMACFHCLEFFIPSLWNQISTEQREDLFHSDEFKLVQLWTYKLSGKIEDLIPGEDTFWFHLLKHGVREGSMSTVLHCWDKLLLRVRQDVLTDVAMEAVIRICVRIERDFIMYLDPLASPAPYIDILCFLLTQMSKTEMGIFFEIALQNTEHNVLMCFLHWPYIDLLLPILKKLWHILPEVKYVDLLFTLAINYDNKYGHIIRRNGYVDYYYGSQIIELLKETPYHFKRYVFRENYDTNTNTLTKDEFLYIVMSKELRPIRRKDIFQKVWQHLILEEKQSFLRTEHGQLFSCFLGLAGNWELLNSVLSECFRENDIAMLQKKLLRSESGKIACFILMKDGDKELFNSFLNWGLQTTEIFPFILKIFFKGRRFDLKDVYNFEIDMDFFYNVINGYAPSKDAGRKFKSRFVKLCSKDVCTDLILQLKYQELDQYLTWGFPSERDKIRFKTWFVGEFAMRLCEILIHEEKLNVAEHFISWCFPSQEAAEQFRQELFFFTGLLLQCIMLDSFSHDLDRLIKWFKLGPQATLKFKKEVLFRSSSLNSFFTYLSKLEKHHIRKKEFSDFMVHEVALILKWGLADKETAIAFRVFSKIHLKNFSFSNDDVRRWVHQTWDTLIKERLSYLSTEQKNLTNVQNL